MSHCKHVDVNAQSAMEQTRRAVAVVLRSHGEEGFAAYRPGSRAPSARKRVSPLSRTDALQCRAAIGSKPLSDWKRCLFESGRKRKGNVFLSNR